MPSPVIAGNSFAPGLKTEFLKTYFRKYEGLKEQLGKIGQIGLPSDKDIETYFHWTSTPNLKRWIRGTGVSQKAFAGVKFTAANLEWAQTIPWHFADEQDDQTKSLPDKVREVAESAALLDERVFFQIMQAGTDPDLLTTIPTAPDGQALFSATNDGSTARFGVTNGNLLSGSGIDTAAHIETDFFSAVEQFRLFQDTEGQPLWDRSVIDGGFIIFHRASGTAAKFFANVFQQGQTHSVLSSTGAGVSNVIVDRGHKVELVPTSRVTSDDWFIALVKSPQKALFSQERMKPLEFNEAWDNSDVVRRTGYKDFGVVLRRGYGISEPYQFIKINN